MVMTRLVGASVKRKEDPRFITGYGSYTDDIRLPGMLYLQIVRSPHPHARIKRIDTSKARSMPGVRGVFTGQDLHDKVAPVPCAWLPPDSDLKVPTYRALAVDTVRYVGDAVAAVVAETPYQASDAADEVVV